MALNDLSYDVITALQSKLEAVAAYEQYIEDCDDAGDDESRKLFEEILQDDERHIERLRDTLERLVRENKFR
jgi:bacterioferritin (cytochrome b1)